MRAPIKFFFVTCLVVMIAAVSSQLPSAAPPRAEVLAQVQGIEPDVTLETLAESPPLPTALPASTTALQRITVPIDGSQDLVFFGPTLLYVESGEMQFVYDPDVTSVVYPSTDEYSPRFKLMEGQISVLPGRYALYSTSGSFGNIKAVGSESLKVLISTIVPVQGDAAGESESESKSSDDVTPEDYVH